MISLKITIGQITQFQVTNIEG